MFYNWKRKKQYLLGEKKLNIINWWICIWAISKNILHVSIKHKDLTLYILSILIDCSQYKLNFHGSLGSAAFYRLVKNINNSHAANRINLKSIQLKF